ncbi:class III poly(R)-hydroxyalkanoic acid synthase subunit PhaC [Desulforhabdus amnigena]|jgi:polyhydroxyalkanoate synthase|uniref:Poly(3-hydroxyalkanoate) polymerase subunit PhaC n=1 Tax=Desulforhabdus amnigena TaxID=40218 RepID=A0A9W6D4X8_9BACT|nr:class III poly(R)-hydroxyalkanoic acid synthase subunit PhaC [Desulforhabdus amnigena]NLJ29295.1 class III poly(R)-hydroxyalkanoic acid synthase subunit PhaC [Deltaproteobacteria bacterium]GLI34643.1 poly-beta-hydroxybutyrate polymerase [Desulforhabdus amnigena]
MSPIKIPVDLILNKLAEDVEKSQDRILKSKDVLLGPLDTSIATTPYEVLYEEDRVKLKHYIPTQKTQLKTPLLMVYALINRETMLDLQPGRSVVQNLLDEGVDLYMIDWGYPARKDRYLTIDDHVNGYMSNVIDFILHRHKLPRINLMGICMGGSFSIMYSALHPEKVQNLITTVTPSNFDTDKGLLHIWMKGIDVDRMVDTYGNMPGDLLNMGFLLLNPARLMLDKYVGFLENMDDKVFVENFIRMEKWIFDSPDVPGETFRQFIKDCYQKNLLIQSKMELGGRRVDLKNVTMPLLNIYGRYDHLVPPEACEHLTSRVGSKDTEDICLNTGHIGIYVSSKCQRELTPKIVGWLKERDETGATQVSRKDVSNISSVRKDAAKTRKTQAAASSKTRKQDPRESKS